jgi:hypothetical protein
MNAYISICIVLCFCNLISAELTAHSSPPRGTNVSQYVWNSSTSIHPPPKTVANMSIIEERKKWLSIINSNKRIAVLTRDRFRFIGKGSTLGSAQNSLYVGLYKDGHIFLRETFASYFYDSYRINKLRNIWQGLLRDVVWVVNSQGSDISNINFYESHYLDSFQFGISENLRSKFNDFDDVSEYLEDRWNFTPIAWSKRRYYYSGAGQITFTFVIFSFLAWFIVL